MFNSLAAWVEPRRSTNCTALCMNSARPTLNLDFHRSSCFVYILAGSVHQRCSCEARASHHAKIFKLFVNSDSAFIARWRASTNERTRANSNGAMKALLAFETDQCNILNASLLRSISVRPSDCRESAPREDQYVRRRSGRQQIFVVDQCSYFSVREVIEATFLLDLVLRARCSK